MSPHAFTGASDHSNPFHVTSLFLCPMDTPENQKLTPEGIE